VLLLTVEFYENQLRISSNQNRLCPALDDTVDKPLRCYFSLNIRDSLSLVIVMSRNDGKYHVRQGIRRHASGLYTLKKF
jgi:hypothetical protein